VAAALPRLLSTDDAAAGAALESLWARAEAGLARLNAQREPEARVLVESGQRGLNARAQKLGELLLAGAGVGGGSGGAGGADASADGDNDQAAAARGREAGDGTGSRGGGDGDAVVEMR
jgi:hypothetical protein